MSELTIYGFLGTRNNYGDDIYALGGCHFTYDATEYYFGESDLSTGSCYLLLANALHAIGDDLPDVNSILFILSPTSSVAGADDTLKRLISSKHDKDAIKQSIELSGNFSEDDKVGLIKFLDWLILLNTKKIKIKTRYKETPDTFKGALMVDGCAGRTYYSRLMGYGNSYKEIIAIKDKKKRAKGLPKLIQDNLIYNWTTDTALPQQPDLNVYYSGNAQLDNTKPKSKKSDKYLDKSHVYYTGSNRKLRTLGKVCAENRYNVVILKEECQYLTKLFKLQKEISHKIHGSFPFTTFKTRSVFGGGVSNFIDSEDYSHIGYSLEGDLFTTSSPRNDLSYVSSPPRDAFKVKELLEENLIKLLSFINKTNDQYNYVVTNVTESLYNTSGEKPTLHENLIKAERVIIGGVKLENNRTAKLKARFKQDLPDYAFFKKLLKDEPQVYVMTWMLDEHMACYAFIIETKEGWLFYNAYYGSRFLLRTASKQAREKLKHN